MANFPLQLTNIQGNILGGFNKDFQSFLFLSFTSETTGRAWIAEISNSGFDEGVASSSSADVLKFNGEFKALKTQGLAPEQFISTSWTNIALSFAGLKYLNIKAQDLALFPQAFKDGMAARNLQIGDLGDSAPKKWTAPFKTPAATHAILLIAADSEILLANRTKAIKASNAFIAGVNIITNVIEGRTRLGQERGHEHFGFKDGVSQPGIRDVTQQDDPIGNPDQGQPGQDLLWPGEFVIGYPTQIPTAKVDVDGPNPDPGPVSTSGPAWTKDGSYLVFRRLQQNVPAFQKQIIDLAAINGISPDLMGAKLVGRYKSGCPIETRTYASVKPTNAPSKDPGSKQPALADSDSLNNNFEFGDDENGMLCPLASHIRKAYPRDEQTLATKAGSESETQTHRLLRRGIPFGGSIGDAVGGKASDPRGLLFLCYQKDIEKQFEFVQSKWVNDAQFPAFPTGRPTPGEDPIIAQSASGLFQLNPTGSTQTINHFVTTTGGEYFLSPSIQTLKEIGAGNI